MTFSHSLRRRIRRVSVSFLGVSATFYFVFHVFHGDRGLIAWAQLRQQVVEVEVAASLVELLLLLLLLMLLFSSSERSF